MYILLYAHVLALSMVTPPPHHLHHNMLMYAPLMAYMPLLTTSCDKFNLVFLPFFYVAVFILIYALMLAFSMVKASRLLHHNMLLRILRCPMSFFDTTPSGRILNRFSRDVETVDNVLPEVLPLHS